MKVTEITNGKVRCIRYNQNDERRFTIGKVYEVKNDTIQSDSGFTYRNYSPYTSVIDWLRRWYEFELVEEKQEEKKVFTKKDIKTGMFGVMNDDKRFVIVDDLIVYEKGSFDRVSGMDEDLDLIFYRIDKLYSNCKSFNMLGEVLKGECYAVECVYDRERDTKPALYNGKVVCVDAGANTHFYTVGKIYQFVDGVLTSDNDIPMRNHGKPFTSFEAWSKWTGSKFIEIKE